MAPPSPNTTRGHLWEIAPISKYGTGSSLGNSPRPHITTEVFAPQGRRVAPIKVKFGREERTVGPLLSAKFDPDRFRVGGLRPPKLKKFEFSQYSCP